MDVGGAASGVPVYEGTALVCLRRCCWDVFCQRHTKVSLNAGSHLCFRFVFHTKVFCATDYDKDLAVECVVDDD